MSSKAHVWGEMLSSSCWEPRNFLPHPCRGMTCVSYALYVLYVIYAAVHVACAAHIVDHVVCAVCALPVAGVTTRAWHEPPCAARLHHFKIAALTCFCRLYMGPKRLKLSGNESYNVSSGTAATTSPSPHLLHKKKKMKLFDAVVHLQENTRRMQLILHAACRTPHGALRLVQAMSAWSVKTRRATSRHNRNARVYGHTTTAMHGNSTSPSTPFFSKSKDGTTAANSSSKKMIPNPTVSLRKKVKTATAAIGYTSRTPRLLLNHRG